MWFLISPKSLLIVSYGWNALAQCQSSVNPALCSRLSSNCLFATSECAPTISSCAYSYCAVCTSLGIQPAIEPCCAAPTQTACFSDLLSGSPLSQTGNFATITNQPAPPACQSAVNIIDSCIAATPDFTDLEFSSQFSCLCSKDGVYAPSIYDGYTSTCLAYLSSVSPAAYLSIGGQISGTNIIRTPCQHFATNPGAFPTTGPLSVPTITPAPSSPSATSNGNSLLKLDTRYVFEMRPMIRFTILQHPSSSVQLLGCWKVAYVALVQRRSALWIKYHTCLLTYPCAVAVVSIWHSRGHCCGDMENWLHDHSMYASNEGT
jgi:hypothetical protein